jgi:branched-chain amino acid transport system substrate-binding protein
MIKRKTIYSILFIITPYLLFIIINSNNSSVKADKNEIKIAAIFAKSGIAAKTHQHQFNSARLAVNLINRNGGILGKKIRLIELDNKSTPIGSKVAAQKAVAEKVIAVIGCSRSSNSIAAALVLQKAKIIMISTGSTNPKVTKIGNYIFRVCFLDTLQGQIMANFARNNLKSKTAVVLTNTTHSYSIDLSKFFIKQYKKLGGTILWQKDYIENMSDYSDTLKKVKLLAPDILYIPAYAKDSGQIMRQARSMGIKSIFLGGDGWGTEIFVYAQTAINNSYMTDHWFKGINKKNSKLFVKRFKTQFKMNPDSGAALTYDAINLLSKAIRRSRSFDRKVIRNKLSGTKNFHGITGKFSLDKNRNPVKPAVIMKLKNKEYYFIKLIRP